MRPPPNGNRNGNNNHHRFNNNSHISKNYHGRHDRNNGSYKGYNIPRKRFHGGFQDSIRNGGYQRRQLNDSDIDNMNGSDKRSNWCRPNFNGRKSNDSRGSWKGDDRSFDNGRKRENGQRNGVDSSSNGTNGVRPSPIPKKTSPPNGDNSSLANLTSQIVKVVKAASVIIFIGETGCGKSTKIPQIILDKCMDGCGKIAITQPRRVAAISLASKVADERKCEIGEEVGYKVRFEKSTGDSTKLIYMTDGMLLRELTFDEGLTDYDCIILDEIHERTVDSDVLLFMLKRLQSKAAKLRNGKPLKLVLMSATTDVVKLKNYLPGSQAYYIPGRTFAVKLFNTKEKNDDYAELAIRTVIQLHEEEDVKSGFLVFLTGQEEIEMVCAELKRELKASSKDFMVIPFYAALGHHRQDVFEPMLPSRRKIVVATNVAETSITIPDIRVVIDSGKVKQKRYVHDKRLDELNVVDISQAQAIQRAGRAGRTAAGKCMRLYSEDAYNKFSPQTVPEIERSNLSQILLFMFSLNIKLSELQFLDTPAEQCWLDALFELYALKLIAFMPGIASNDRGINNFYNMAPEDRIKQRYTCTASGNFVRRLPVSPMLGLFLLQADRMGCREEAVRIVSFCSMSEDVFIPLRDKTEEERREIERNREKFQPEQPSDHLLLVKIHKACTKMEAQGSLKKFCESNGLNFKVVREALKIRKALRVALDKARNFTGKRANEPESDKPVHERLNNALRESFFLNACIFTGDTERYTYAFDPTVRIRIHPTSYLKGRNPRAFVFTELVRTNDLYARVISGVDQNELFGRLQKCGADVEKLAKKPGPNQLPRKRFG